MQIKIGWSAEINGQWQKLDVDVTDHDLQEFFASKDSLPLMEKLTPNSRFMLMTGIAEELILAYQASHFPIRFPAEEIREELRTVLTRRNKILDALQ